ncbi:MAG: hypothetical protein ABSH28_21480 [Acidobacteriota bacterium]|jgi:hypothetical protein
MEIPEPIGIGYFPKTVTARPNEWAGPALVDEICSASECICSGPKGWMDKWQHNELGFFASEIAAKSVIEGDASMYQMYAYKIYPLEFDRGSAKPWRVPLEVKLVLVLEEFEFLGYDPISRLGGRQPEHSPLSCNCGANEFQVNRHCLFYDLEQAYGACIKISNGNYEPGPYYLLEVYRRRQGS